MLQIPSTGKTSKGQGSVREEQKAQVAGSSKKAQGPRMAMKNLVTNILDSFFTSIRCFTALHQSLVTNFNVKYKCSTLFVSIELNAGCFTLEVYR
jgi:hypothetical protein